MTNGYDNEDFEEVFNRLKQDTNELGSALRGCANQALSDAHDSVNNTVQQARDAMHEYVENYAERTRQRPMTTLLKWAGFGFLIGWLMRRR